MARSLVSGSAITEAYDDVLARAPAKTCARSMLRTNTIRFIVAILIFEYVNTLALKWSVYDRLKDFT
jgi:hypothetical protein